MTNYRQVAPRIRWGSTMQNALDIGYPLDVVTSWSAKREGSVDVQGPSGVEESWTVGTDYLLKGDARWIPQSDTLGPPKATGWDGTSGFRAFLEWARDKNVLYFHPDGRNLLLNPTCLTDSNNDGLADSWAKDYSTLAIGTWSKPTALFIAGSQAIAMANTSVLNDYIGISQTIPNVMPGEVLTVSADLCLDGASLNVDVALWYAFYDINGAVITSGEAAGLGAPSNAFARFGLYAPAAPANTASAATFARIRATVAGAHGTLYVKNVMARRNGVTDSTFIDNPMIASYLLDPRMTRTAISLEPAAAQEPDGTRRVTLLLRNPSSPYDGF